MTQVTSRRTFLLVGVGLGLSALAGPHTLRLAGLMAPVPLADRLAALFHGQRSARLIGAEYLGEAPAETSLRALLNALGEGVEGGLPALGAATDHELRAIVANRTCRDFETGQTVSMHGWILSRTEGRLCAIAALKDGR